MKKLFAFLLSVACVFCACTAIVVAQDETAATTELVPESVYFTDSSDWGCLMVDFGSTTANTGDQTVNNTNAIGKISYTRLDGSALDVWAIYSLGTRLGCFIRPATGGNNLTGPVKGDRVIIAAGCGFLDNEATSKEYVYEYDGVSYKLIEDEFKTLYPEQVYISDSSDWGCLMVDFNISTAHTGSQTVDNTNAVGKITYTRADGTEMEVWAIYSLGTRLGCFVRPVGGPKITEAVKGDRVTIASGCGFMDDERTRQEYVFEYDGTRFNLILDEYEEIVPTQVNYSPANGGWDAYLVNFAGTTQNPNEYNAIGRNNAFALGKITYERDGITTEVTNIYTMGTNLGVFVNNTSVDPAARIGAPQNGDKIIIAEGCGFLFNERTEQEYVFVYNGTAFELEGAGPELPPEEECKTLTIVNAYHCYNWAMEQGGQAFQVDFGASTVGLGTYAPAVTGTDYIEYVDTFGNPQPIADFICVGGGNMIFRVGNSIDDLIDKVRVGDRVTFKAGLRINADEMLKEDVSFVVSALSTGAAVPMAPYVGDPTSFELTEPDESTSFPAETAYQLTWTLSAGTYATPVFTSETPDIAEVDENGQVTFLAPGTATIKAVVNGKLEDSVTFEVIEAVAVDHVETTIYTVWVQKGQTIAYPADWTVTAVYEGEDLTGPAVPLTVGDNLSVIADDLNTNEVGEYTLPATITLNGEVYDTTIPVAVYEPMEIIVKELGIVDWFSYATFVQYPDASMNNGNITNGPDLGFTDVLEKIEYRRADGTVVELGYYFLSGGNLCLMPNFLNEKITITVDGEEKEIGPNDKELFLEYFNKAPYYQAGDTITLKAGLKLYRWTGELAPTAEDQNALAPGTGMYIVETVVNEDMIYRFDGNVWGFFKEYTGMAVANESITMNFGARQDAGVTREPSNATTGTFSYVSSDESVVRVTDRGVLDAVGLGTATITVTLDGGTAGKFEKTIEVTVQDARTGIAITPEEITIGAEDDLLAELTAVTVWASGKAGESVDLTDAQIIGLNTEITGEAQTVTIRVTVDGETLSGTVLVTVKGGGCQGGCGGSASGAVFGLGVLVLLGGVLLIAKRKA